MNLDAKQTTVHLNIRFREGDHYYHLLKYAACPDDIKVSDDSKLAANPIRLSFNIGKTLQTNDEIAEAVVKYLSTLKLYLYSYEITNSRMYVSYTRKTPAFSDKLSFSPTYQSLDLFIDAEAQKENGVDYEKELNIKLHHPISTITPKEIRGFGLELDDIGVEIPAIIREDELPENY